MMKNILKRIFSKTIRQIEQDAIWNAIRRDQPVVITDSASLHRLKSNSVGFRGLSAMNTADYRSYPFRTAIVDRRYADYSTHEGTVRNIVRSRMQTFPRESRVLIVADNIEVIKC